MIRLVLSSLALAALAGTSTAQDHYVFVIDEAASNFTYSGSVDFGGVITGDLQGIPDNKFNLQGTADGVLTDTVSAGPVNIGQLVSGGSATTVPQLEAVIPNPIAFLPPLASMTVQGLEMEFISVDPLFGTPINFVVGPTGNFLANIQMTFLGGTADVDAGILGTFQLVFTGESTPWEEVPGCTLTPSAEGFDVVMPLSITVPIDEPGLGLMANLTLTGTVVAEWKPLNSEVSEVSISGGGTQDLVLSSAGVLPFNPYLVVGSLSGTSPGFPLGGGLILPLNFDAFLNFSLANANQPPFTGTFGTLDANGKALGAFTLPAGAANPGLAGASLNFAYVVLDMGAGAAVSFASNAQPLLLTP